MIIAETVAALRRALAKLRAQRRRIAFVPTMGNLHAGHLRLVDEARRYAEAVVVSIYVNPLQFGPQEDFAAYPRTPAEDQALLAARDVELLFRPGDGEIYPRGLEAMTKVEVPGLSDILCGAFRPGHFRGVATVVNRLFNLVQPDVALFGKKDYQQWLIIRRMVEDLGMPVEIVGIETVREPDGLAMSSRNRRLSPEQRRAAPAIYRALQAAAAQVAAGRRDPAEVRRAALAVLESEPLLRTEYFEIVDPGEIQPVAEIEREVLIACAVWAGTTRLIDSVRARPPVSL